MKAKLLNEQGEKVYALVFDPDDEVTDSLLQFANEHGLRVADARACP